MLERCNKAPLIVSIPQLIPSHPTSALQRICTPHKHAGCIPQLLRITACLESPFTKHDSCITVLMAQRAAPLQIPVWSAPTFFTLLMWHPLHIVGSPGGTLAVCASKQQNAARSLCVAVWCSASRSAGLGQGWPPHGARGACARSAAGEGVDPCGPQPDRRPPGASVSLFNVLRSA